MVTAHPVAQPGPVTPAEQGYETMTAQFDSLRLPHKSHCHFREEVPMDVKEAIRTRRAYRSLEPIEVTEELVRDLAAESAQRR